MKLQLVALTILFFLIKISFAKQDTIRILNNTKQVIYNEKETYFFSKKDVPIQKILTENFRTRKNIHLAYITGWVWVKLIVKNHSKSERFVLHTSDGHISGVYLYKPTPFNKYQVTPPRQHHPEDGREVYNRIPAFFIDIKKEQTQVFYLKIAAQNEVVNFNYIIESNEQFIESVQLDYMIIGLYFGALLIIIIVNIFYFVSLKDKLFLVYAGYVFSGILITATLDGFSWLLIPDPDIAYHVNFLCIRLWPVSLLFFTIQLVNLKKYKKRFTIICYSFMIYHLVGMSFLDYINAFNIRTNLMAQWETVNWGISILLTFFVVGISYKNNKYLFKYYLIAYGVLIIVSIFASMHGINAENWLIFEHGFKVGTLIEMITLSFAVSRRFKLTENDLRKKVEEEQQLTTKVNQLEMDVRKAQMNPHFMFNALTSIEYFIFKNDPENARRYLNKFADLMRLTLDNSRSNYIPLRDELTALNFYVELEFLRLKAYPHYFEINVDREVDQDNIHVPALLIQPFVENAIWHGLQKKELAGKLVISIKFRENELICTIEDDGGGIKKKEMPLKRKSSGILITKERLLLVHTLLKTVYKFSIENVNDENNQIIGTQVAFSMPYITE